MDALALVLTVAAAVMFAFAASGRELRRFNEIALGLGTTDALIAEGLVSADDAAPHRRDAAVGQQCDAEGIPSQILALP